MKLSLIVPWVLVAASLSAAGVFFSSNQKKDAELATLRADSDQLQKTRAELEELKNNQTQSASDELTRLRRDHDELLRLRSRVQEMRGEAQALQGQVQAAQNQAQSAQAQAQALSAKAAAQPIPPPPGAPPPVSPEEANAAACINNLRLIYAAKKQWATQNDKPSGALMTPADIAVFLPNNAVPSCPAGGIYTINPVGIIPLCNVPGHTLSK